MIARGRMNGRPEVKETVPEAKGQVNLCHETKWIHRHFAASNAIEQRVGKGRSGAVTTVPIIAAVATREVIAAEAFREAVVVVLGVAVADANGMMGNSGGGGDFKRRRGSSEGEKTRMRFTTFCGAAPAIVPQRA